MASAPADIDHSDTELLSDDFKHLELIASIGSKSKPQKGKHKHGSPGKFSKQGKHLNSGTCGNQMSGSTTAGDNVNDDEDDLPIPSINSNSEEMDQLEIDLTDPDDLLTKLDGVDLTDEQFEVLMEQALSINRQLKQHVRQSGFSSKTTLHSADNPRNQRHNSRNPKSVVLPPIPGASRSSSSSLPPKAFTGSAKTRRNSKPH